MCLCVGWSADRGVAHMGRQHIENSSGEWSRTCRATTRLDVLPRNYSFY